MKSNFFVFMLVSELFMYSAYAMECKQIKPLRFLVARKIAQSNVLQQHDLSPNALQYLDLVRLFLECKTLDKGEKKFLATLINKPDIMFAKYENFFRI